MSHDRNPAAACDRLLDALVLELLHSGDDELGPRHGGQSLKAAADQVRWHVSQAVQRSAADGAPVFPRPRKGAPPSLMDDGPDNSRRRR